MPLAAVNGTEVFYRSDGDAGDGNGDPVVLVPGLGATHQSFAGIVPALAARYQVVSLDLRGVGQSARPRQRYSMELWADDVAALLDHLGIDRAHVVGSSLGGCVAQALATRHPDRARSLVLAASFAELDPLLRLNYEVRIALVEEAGMGPLFAGYATATLFGSTFLGTPDGRAIAELAMAALRANDPDLYVEHLHALLRFGEPGPSAGLARLAAVTVPALVLCGEEDVLTAPRFSRAMAAALPDATLHVQPACGHANLVERADECARLILDFFGNLKEGT